MATPPGAGEDDTRAQLVELLQSGTKYTLASVTAQTFADAIIAAGWLPPDEDQAMRLKYPMYSLTAMGCPWQWCPLEHARIQAEEARSRALRQ